MWHLMHTCMSASTINAYMHSLPVLWLALNNFMASPLASPYNRNLLHWSSIIEG